MRLAVSALLLCLGMAATGVSSGAATGQLPEPVSSALKHARIPLSDVGIVVQEVDAPAPLIALNAGKAMNPASTMKLLTTFAALETLGPAYRWKTEAYLDGKLENGVLQGNLVFKGYGDPKLTVEQFWMWLHELRQRGLRDIRGDIVLDHGFFVDPTEIPAQFDNDPTRAYNVGTNALLLNFNAIHLRLIPNGQAASAVLDPDLAGYTVQNGITASAKLACRTENAFSASVEGHTIKLEGRIPADCGEVDDYFSPLPHDEYFFSVFSALWRELGGTVQGTLRTGHAPALQMPYATYVSPELSEVIRDINKFSNNIMARQLFLTLGTADASEIAASGVAAAKGGAGGPEAADAQGNRGASASQGSSETGAKNLAAPANPEPGAGGSIARSIARMHAWLTTRQLDFPELVLENGSGLSRKERISAGHLAQLLQRIAHSPYSAELEASLPILGVDGTVKKRFHDSELAGHAHLKTGTLDNVKSLAGFVDGPTGKKWILVFIINHPHAPLGRVAQDALLEWVGRQGGD